MASNVQFPRLITKPPRVATSPSSFPLEDRIVVRLKRKPNTRKDGTGQSSTAEIDRPGGSSHEASSTSCAATSDDFDLDDDFDGPDDTDLREEDLDEDDFTGLSDDPDEQRRQINRRKARSGDVIDDPYLAFNREFLRFMLSDGAGAMLIEDRPRAEGPALRIDWLDMLSFANELDACMYTGAVKHPDGSLHGWRSEEGGPTEAVRKGYFNLAQDVNLLSENIVKMAGRFFAEVLKRHELKPENVDWLLPHISSMFFQQSLYEEMARIGFDFPPEKWFTNLKYKGNTGAASIFIMLEELHRSGKLKQGDRILCAVPESARFTYACIHLTVQ